MPSRWILRLYGSLPRSLTHWVVRWVYGGLPVGVVVVVFDPADRVLVLEHTYGHPRWRLPGGLVERGEQPQDTARREVAEEACCNIQAVAVFDAAMLRYSLDIAVVAVLLDERPFQPSTEISGKRWTELGDLRALPPEQQAFVAGAIRARAAYRGESLADRHQQ